MQYTCNMAKIILDKQLLENMYSSGISSRKIASALGCSKPTVLKALREYKIPVRKNQGTSYEEYTVNHDYFEVPSPSMYYVLGYIAADGFINKIGTGVQFTSKDLELLEFCKQELETNCPIKFRLGYDKRNLEKYIYTLYVPSKRIVNSLNKLGLTTKKSLTLTFPDISDDYLWHYLRGYLDGDGWIKKFEPKEGPRLTIISSPYFIKSLKNKLETIFNKALSQPRPYGKALGLTIRGLSAYKMLKLLYDNEHYGLSRKKERALAYVTYGKMRQKT